MLAECNQLTNIKLSAMMKTSASWIPPTPLNDTRVLAFPFGFVPQFVNDWSLPIPASINSIFLFLFSNLPDLLLTVAVVSGSDLQPC